MSESISFRFQIKIEIYFAGKIKVNESQIITSNIPATNGVIHAIDSRL